MPRSDMMSRTVADAIRHNWPALSDSEVLWIQGHRDRLLYCLVCTYGLSRDAAGKQISEFVEVWKRLGIREESLSGLLSRDSVAVGSGPSAASLSARSGSSAEGATNVQGRRHASYLLAPSAPEPS